MYVYHFVIIMYYAPFYFPKYLNLDDKLHEHLTLNNQAETIFE